MSELVGSPALGSEANVWASVHADDDLVVVKINRIGPQRCGASCRASGIELESVQMERAQYDAVVDLAVCKGSALVRANR